MLALWLAVAGCGGAGPAVDLTTYDPDAAARQALAQYDKDRDGKLDPTELEACPALRESLTELDRNRDGYLSAEEIAERLRLYQDSKISMMTVPCRVYQGEEPLKGATVTAVPEKFMGDSVQPATGVSDDDGNVQLKVADLPYAGLRCGFYRIVISLKDAAGKETLPAEYNTETTLGREVSPRTQRRFLFRLH